ncbi:dehydrogenase [Sphaerisporangium rufum]|uniref:Dehydrogenase n=1 Tax=Sphaerisporangium rufum TaxID=1381558 RepID=A0A919R703_9ACTN|nr:NAD(P)-binding domain-containing protein [Sphaerisporangium rufum]GII80784.1 dehydrogenase [Sphaerisporangium rufum]
MSGENRPPVTVIGLGAMGTALAGAFLDRGHPTTVWNRTGGKAAPLAARGATVAATAAGALAASPLTVVCVLDDRAVHEALDPVAGALAGRTLVNLTNSTPEQARATARWARERGAGYLDGGIMAVPPMIGRPESLILYSGPAATFDAHLATLSVLGSPMYLGEDDGRAALYDIALLGAMYGMFGGYLNAVALTRAAGVPATELTPLIVSWLQAMLTGLPRMAKGVDAGDHAAAASNVRMQALGYVNLLDTARDQGVRTELMAPMGELLDRAVAAGRGEGDLSGLVDLLRAPEGTR